MTNQNYWRHAPGGVELFVRLTPRSSRDMIEGVETGTDGRRHLKARVRAIPEDGKANKALIKLVSKTLRVPASSITVTAGQTSRLKTLHIAANAPDIEALFAGDKTFPTKAQSRRSEPEQNQSEV